MKSVERREMQGDSGATAGKKRIYWTVWRRMQYCRKSDLFSAQAWRGDDCARQLRRKDSGA